MTSQARIKTLNPPASRPSKMQLFYTGLLNCKAAAGTPERTNRIRFELIAFLIRSATEAYAGVLFGRDHC